jgi:outer membrane protein assembly factor BamB
MGAVIPWLLLVLVGQVPAAAAQIAEDNTRGFSLHDTEAARATQREADGHFAAGRWSEGIVLLQELIERHRGEVLGETRPTLGGQGEGWSANRVSQQPVFEGASDFATRRLIGLNAEAKRLYQRRYGESAARALLEALEQSSMRALANVGRRWPITTEAERAWWALGDLELEAGNFGDGVRAWSRALERALGDLDLGLAATAPALALGDTPAGEAARASWIQATERLEAIRGVPACRSIRARVQHFLSTEGRKAAAQARSQRDTSAASALHAGTLPLSLPGNHAEGWREPYTLPQGPYDASARSGRRSVGREFVLFPARWRETIFLTTSLQVVALHAFTGDVAWESGEPSEWGSVTAHNREEILGQVTSNDCLVAPAAASGVVVAALQIPYVFEPQFTFGDMPIIREQPNRRLFAFDARTGEALWDTRPPPDWDGESGSLAQRARVVGPPIIEGSRLLVPLARLRGRIEYSVACFDLFTGELLWATSLISGQRELNMFGRMAREFCAPPLVVEGTQVLALTQLGTLASLDLFTGDVRWEVLYDTIKIRKNNDFDTNPLSNEWRNAPPVVVDGVVFATPFDSRDLVAVDLASGGMIWSQNHATLTQIGLGSRSGRNGELNLLVGADEDRIYLAGHRVVALESTQGKVTRNRVDKFGWAFPAGLELETQLDPEGPRPVLDGRRIHVPDKDLFSIDRASGRLMGKMEWLQGSRGNLLLSEGVLLSLSRRSLAAYFEWEQLVEEARRRQRSQPGDPRPAVQLAGLLRSRGLSEWGRDDEGRATRYLDEARAVLEPFVATTAGDVLRTPDPRAAEELHQVLRTEARVLRDLARRTRAIELLERARALASNREDLRDTLLEEQALLRGRDPRAHAERLDLLLEQCGDLPLFLDISADEHAELADRLVPVVGSEPQSGPGFAQTTVGLWVLVQRASLAARGPTSAEEFADLHAILAEFADARLGAVLAGVWATDRIGARLAAGQRKGYEAFEERAESLFDRALEERDPELLERVGRVYPHSRAAALANEARLAMAVDALDVGRTAEIVLGELPERWSARQASERQLRHLMRLAHVLGESGSTRARAGLLGELARDHGELRSDLPGSEGVTLGELARAASPEPPSAPPEPTFDARARLRSAIEGSFRPLCTIPTARAELPAVQVFVTDTELVGFGPDSPETPLWRTPIVRGEVGSRQRERTVVVPGRVILTGGDRFFAVDAADGHIPWERSLDGASVQEISESQGVLVVSMLQKSPWSETPRFEAVAVGLDARGGHELWRLTVATELAGGRVFADGGRLFVLSGRTSGRIELRDLYTSRLISETEIEPLTEPSLPEAFVAGGRLILPRFQSGMWPDQNHVLGLELDSLQTAWRIDIGDGKRDGSELQMVLTHADDVYLVVRGERRGSIAASGAIY